MTLSIIIIIMLQNHQTMKVLFDNYMCCLTTICDTYSNPFLHIFWRNWKTCRITFSTNRNGACMSGSASGTNRTIPTSTSGAGTNDLPPIVKRCWTSQRYWHITDRRQRCTFNGGAAMRSATSFWNVSISGTRPCFHAPRCIEMSSSQRIISGVDTLNGRLPIIFRWGCVSFHRVDNSLGKICSMSKCRTSPLKMRIIPPDASFSIYIQHREKYHHHQFIIIIIIIIIIFIF